MAQKSNKSVKPTIASSPQPPGKWTILLMAGAVIAVTLLVLSPVTGNTFINWDDNFYVFDNTHIDESFINAVTYYFGPHYFVGNYVPLTMLVFSTEYHLAGMDAHFFHSVNLFIHLVNVGLVFWLALLWSDRKPWVATLTALFFGIHPMHVESVAWISELKDTLYTMFFIAGLIAYHKYAMQFAQANSPSVPAKKNFNWLIIAFLWFLLSCLSKPAAIIFPLVLLSVDYLQQRKMNKLAVVEKLPFALCSLIFGIVAITAQQADRLLHQYYTISQKIFFASYALIMYVVKLFAPAHLVIFYPYPTAVDGHLPYYYYIAPLLVIALGFAVYKAARYSRIIAFGFLFFVINLLLVLQLVSVGDAIMAERYTYVSYIGLFFAAAMLLHKWYNVGAKPYRNIVTAVVCCTLLACAYLSNARCKVWLDQDTVADDLVAKYPYDKLALNNKGFLLINNGNYQASVEYFMRAIHTDSAYVRAYANLTNAYLHLNDFDDAVKCNALALTHAPQDYDLLTTRGYFLYRQHRYNEAIASLKRALSFKKDNIDTYMFLALSYFDQKDYNSWQQAIDEGLKYDPRSYLLLNNKGYGLFAQKKYNEALECYKASLSINPDYQLAKTNIANCYRALNDSINHANTN